MLRTGDSESTIDVISGLLFNWRPEQLEAVGARLLAELLAHAPRVPDEAETAFADFESLPGFLVHESWPDEARVVALVARYKQLDATDRRRERVLTGVQCLALLLLAFDTRMRRFVWGQHGLHAIFATHDVERSPELQARADVFIDALKEAARVFVADIKCARREDDPDIVGRLASEFVDYARRLWSFTGEDFDWAPDEDDTD